MKTPSTLGLTLSAIYIVISAYFIATQGLFGESFIAILLGLPWSLGFAYFEYGNPTGAMMYVMVLLPLLFNVVLLYMIGWGIGRLRAK